MRAMLPQPSGKADIIRVFQLALFGDQSIQLRFQGLGISRWWSSMVTKTVAFFIRNVLII